MIYFIQAKYIPKCIPFVINYKNVYAHWLSRVRLCDPVSCSLLAPLSMGLSGENTWSGFPFLLQGLF